MSIMIYGGAFDPFHLGHRYALSQVPDDCDITDIFIVPTFQTPLKERAQFTDQQRIILIETILSDLPKPNPKVNLHIDTFEIRQKKQQFAIDTVTYFKEKFKRTSCFLLMGSDCFFQFQRWKEVHRLVNWINLIVVKRDEHDISTYLQHFNKFFPNQSKNKINVVGSDHKKISSTDLKRKWKGNEWEQLVPKTLIPLIKKFRKENI